MNAPVALPRTSGETLSPSTSQTVESFRLLIARVRDYAIFLLDPDGTVVSWNEGAERTKGYAAHEIIGKNIATFYTPHDQEAGHPAELLRQAEREGRAEEEGWRVRKDGTRFWANVVITAVRDDHGTLVGFGKVTRDLTERRDAELALTELSGRLLQIQDEERRRIARDLHDSTSPLMARLLAKLYTARQKAHPLARPLAEQIDEALGNAESIATVIRTVSSMLHPPMLDEGGLLPSLKWFLEAHGRRVGLQIDAHLPAGIPRLAPALEIALFRIVQESVTVLARHVAANRVRVTIQRSDSLTIEVRLDRPIPGDMQCGHSPRGELAVGMVGMRERLRQLGGTLRVASAMGETVVTAQVPLTGGA